MEKLKTKDIEKCKQIAKNIKKDILDLTYKNSQGHIGGSLSCVEIIACLYGSILNFDKNNLKSPKRDRFILSKGQATMTFYSALKEVGIITKEELLTFKKKDTFLYADLVINEDKGIENSNGSLGQCFSFAIGIALALKMRKNLTPKVYVLIGDGECNEGAIWEGLLFASQHKLDNLILIIDKNKLQYDGFTDEILSLEPLCEKLKSFNWNTIELNGHDIESLIEALNKKYDKPTAIIANTNKGNGISFAQNNPFWHVHSLNLEEYETAKKELGV